MNPAALACALMLAAAPLGAQTFAVTLGGATLGQLSYELRGQTATLRSTFDNTPLGVFNGTFAGTSRGSAATSTFTGESRSSRKSRIVTVEISEGRARETRVTPEHERTELSDVAMVPAGVRDPVRVIGALIGSAGCPPQVQMYDGRRVVRLSPLAEARAGDVLTCELGYRVIAGPGHLSPLRITSARMQLRYATSAGAQQLRQLTLSSGLFSVTLTRTD